MKHSNWFWFCKWAEDVQTRGHEVMTSEQRPGWTLWPQTTAIPVTESNHQGATPWWTDWQTHADTQKPLYHAENDPQCRAASLDPQESHQNPTQTKYLASTGSEFGCLLLVFLTLLRPKEKSSQTQRDEVSAASSRARCCFHWKFFSVLQEQTGRRPPQTDSENPSGPNVVLKMRAAPTAGGHHGFRV